MYYVYSVSIKLIPVLSSGEHIMLSASVWLLREEVLMVVSPANPTYTEEELLHQLTDSGAKGIVTTAELLDVAVAAGRRANIPKDRIILFKEAKGGHQHYTSLFSDHEAESTRGSLSSGDLAFLAYSSGTTGLAKGVMLTHGNIVANSLQGGSIEMKYLHWSRDRMVSFLPFYHI
jgi:4-coumarate--CoA ligase